MNPLSLSSTRLTRAGLDVVGLCEGPLCTAQDVAALLGVPAHEMAWAYTGLNHRGIVHTFAHGDRPIVLDARGRGAPLRHGAAYMPSMNGFLSKEVLQVQAPDSWRYGRAKQVADIRARLMSELLTGEGVDPGSLALRPTPWYCQAVLPFLGAWTGFAAPWQTTVNVELGELFVETRAVVSERDLHTWRNAAPTPDAERFLHGIERHERASIEALYRGDPDAARHALSQDPFIAPDAVDAAWQRLHQLPVFPEFTRT
jgi:6-phospho-beta-glucosidase